MIDIKHKRCKSNKEPYNIDCDTIGNSDYDGFCTFCFGNLFPDDPRTPKIHTKTKELKVVTHLCQIYDNLLYNKLITGQCKCPKRRFIDLHKIINGTMLAIEIDENQHKYYDDDDEKNRYDDIFLGWSGKSIWIRYNPDKYKDNNNRKRNPQFKKRMETLESEIKKQIERIEKYKNLKNEDLCEIIELFYDGY